MTVRIPQDLYDRFADFASKRHFFRGEPQLAGCVREALEHFLTCQAPPAPHTAIPHNGQTENDTPAPVMTNNGQTEKSTTIPATINKRQTENDPGMPTPVRENKRQTESVPTQQIVPILLNAKRQTDIEQKLASGQYYTAPLCPQGHVWLDTDQSVYRGDHICIECDRQNAKKRRDDKKAARQAMTP